MTNPPPFPREPLLPRYPLPTKLTAKVHQVEVCWRLKNTDWIEIGPAPVLVLAARARRDVELRTLRVEFPDFEGGQLQGKASSVLVQVPHVTGLRRLVPELEPYVWGQENVLASAMFGRRAKTEDKAHEPEQIRWWGGCVNCIEHNVNASPCIWWCWCGRIAIPKGASLGVVVRCDVVTRCRARMAGAG